MRNTYLNFIDGGSEGSVNSEEVKKATAGDLLLSKVSDYVMNGWPIKEENSEMKPFMIRSSEITVEKGVLLWGHRVIMPSTLRNR